MDFSSIWNKTSSIQTQCLILLKSAWLGGGKGAFDSELFQHEILRELRFSLTFG